MATITRTEKEFSKENIPLDFLRRALSIAGLDTAPLKFELEDFVIEEKWKGVINEGKWKGASCSPWSEGLAEKGWVKERSGLRIKHTKGFDTFAIIFEQKGIIQPYFKESTNKQYACNQLDWVNLLLEYGFVEISK